MRRKCSQVKALLRVCEPFTIGILKGTTHCPGEQVYKLFRPQEGQQLNFQGFCYIEFFHGRPLAGPGRAGHLFRGRSQSNSLLPRFHVSSNCCFSAHRPMRGGRETTSIWEKLEGRELAFDDDFVVGSLLPCLI